MRDSDGRDGERVCEERGREWRDVERVERDLRERERVERE